MSEHASKDPRFHEGQRKDAFIWIGIAIMLPCPFIACFVIDAQGLCPPPWPNSSGCAVLFSGYAGPANYPWLELEGAGVIWAGALIGYLVFVWRSATRGYSYNAW